MTLPRNSAPIAKYRKSALRIAGKRLPEVFRLATIALALLFANQSAIGAAPWHAEGWALRAVVGVDTATGPNVDVAAVNIFHDGQAAAEGNDYRIFDASGKAVPYEVTYHHPQRDTWISFRATRGQSEFFIYYGKQNAPRDPARTVDAPLGKGPPQPGLAAGGWIPRVGLVLATLERDRASNNPQSVAQMLALIKNSPGPEGARYQSNIADSFNPFGDSDYYISIYRGWIYIPRAGEYGFCTASNEASFSFLDGKDLVHWPGRHTEQRGKHGEFNTTVQLSPGPHYVEYLHEEVLLYQLAYLGYKPPRSEHFEPIPDGMFSLPRSANVLRYERAGSERGVALRPELLDNIWPQERSRGQFTRYRFSADAGSAPQDWRGWTIAWDFGDGLTAAGPLVEHVYLGTGSYQVKLSASGPKGPPIARTWPLAVYPIEQLGGPYREGKIDDYLPIVKSYDTARLNAALLGELVRFFALSGDREGAERMATAMLARPGLDPSVQAAAHLVLAGEAGLAATVWDGAVARDRLPGIVEHLKAAIRLIDDRSARLQAIARLVRVVGIEDHDLPAAAALYAEAIESGKQSKTPSGGPAALAELHLAMGDVYLASRITGKAASVYREAEQLAETPIPQAVRAAKIGAYPESLQQKVDAKNIDEAWTIVRQWRDLFPSDQVNGTALLWQGKLQQLRGKPAASVRPLLLAVSLGEGADFEAEARWLLANAYKQLGDTARYQATLKALTAAGLVGPYREKAIQALKGN